MHKMENRKDITNKRPDAPLEGEKSGQQKDSINADIEKKQLDDYSKDNEQGHEKLCELSEQVIDVEDDEDSSGSEMEFKIPRPPKYVNLAGLTFDIPETDIDTPLEKIPDPDKPEYDIRRFYYSGFERSPPSSPPKKLSRDEIQNMFARQTASLNPFSCVVPGAKNDLTFHNRFPDYLELELNEFSFVDPIFPPNGDYTLKGMISNLKSNISTPENELATSICQPSAIEFCPHSSKSVTSILNKEESVSLIDSTISKFLPSSSNGFPSVSKIEPLVSDNKTFISKSNQYNSSILQNDPSTSNIESSITTLLSSKDFLPILKTEPTRPKSLVSTPTFDEGYSNSLSSVSENEASSKSNSSANHSPSSGDLTTSLEDIESSLVSTPTFDEDSSKSLSFVSENESASKSIRSTLNCDLHLLKNIPPPSEDLTTSLEDIEPSIFEPSIMIDDISIYLNQPDGTKSPDNIPSTSENSLCSMEELFSSNFDSSTMKDELSVYLSQSNAPNIDPCSLENLSPSIQEPTQCDISTLTNGLLSSQNQKSLKHDEKLSKDLPSTSKDEPSKFDPVHLQTLMSFLESKPLTSKSESFTPKFKSCISTAFTFNSKNELSASKNQSSISKSRKRPSKIMKLPKRQPSANKNESLKNNLFCFNCFSSASKMVSTSKNQQTSSKYDLCPMKKISSSWPKFDPPTVKDAPSTSQGQPFTSKYDLSSTENIPSTLNNKLEDLKSFSKFSPPIFEDKLSISFSQPSTSKDFSSISEKEAISKNHPSISKPRKYTWDDYELPKNFPPMPKMKPFSLKCDPNLMKNCLVATEDGQICWEKFDQAILRNEPSTSQSSTSILKYDPNCPKIFIPSSKAEVATAKKEETYNMRKISTQVIERAFKVIDNPNYCTEFTSYPPNYKTDASSTAVEETIEDVPYSLLELLEGQQLLGDEINPYQLSSSDTFQDVTVPPDEEIKVRSERTGIPFNELQELYTAIVENNEIRKMLYQMTVENALTNVNPISKFETHEEYLESERKFMERAEALERYNLTMQAFHRGKKKKTKRTSLEKEQDEVAKINSLPLSVNSDVLGGPPFTYEDCETREIGPNNIHWLAVNAENEIGKPVAVFDYKDMNPQYNTRPLWLDPDFDFNAPVEHKHDLKIYPQFDNVEEAILLEALHTEERVLAIMDQRPSMFTAQHIIQHLRNNNEHRKEDLPPKHDSQPVRKDDEVSTEVGVSQIGESQNQLQMNQYQSMYEPEYSTQYLEQYQPQYLTQNDQQCPYQYEQQYSPKYHTQYTTYYQPVNQFQNQPSADQLPDQYQYVTQWHPEYQSNHQVQDQSQGLTEFQAYGANCGGQYPMELMYPSNYDTPTVKGELSIYQGQPSTLGNGSLNYQNQASASNYGQNLYQLEFYPENQAQDMSEDLVEYKPQCESRCKLKFPSQYEPCQSDDARCRLLNQTLYRAPIYTHKIPGGMPQVTFQRIFLNSIPEERDLEEEEEEQKWTIQIVESRTKLESTSSPFPDLDTNTNQEATDKKILLNESFIEDPVNVPLPTEKDRLPASFPILLHPPMSPEEPAEETDANKIKPVLITSQENGNAVESASNPNISFVKIEPLLSSSKPVVRQSRSNPAENVKITTPEMTFVSSESCPKPPKKKANKRPGIKVRRRRAARKVNENNINFPLDRKENKIPTKVVGRPIKGTRQEIIENNPEYGIYQQQYLQYESQHHSQYQYQFPYPQQFQQYYQPYNQQEYQGQYYPQYHSQLQNYPKYHSVYLQDQSHHLTYYQPVNQYQQQSQVENQLQNQSWYIPHYQPYGANYDQYPMEHTYSLNYNSTTLRFEPSIYQRQQFSMQEFVSPIKYYTPASTNVLISSQDQPSTSNYDENLYQLKYRREWQPQDKSEDLVEPKSQCEPNYEPKVPPQYRPRQSDDTRDTRWRLLNQTLYKPPIYTYKIPGGMPQVFFQATKLSSIPEERDLEEMEMAEVIGKKLLLIESMIKDSAISLLPNVEEPRPPSPSILPPVPPPMVSEVITRETYASKLKKALNTPNRAGNTIQNTSNRSRIFVRSKPFPSPAVRQSERNVELTNDVKISPTDRAAVENASNSKTTFVKSKPPPKTAVRQPRSILEFTKDVGKTSPSNRHAVENDSRSKTTFEKSKPPKTALRQPRSNLEFTKDVGKITIPEMTFSSSVPSPKPGEKQGKRSSGRKKYRPQIENIENVPDRAAVENVSWRKIIVKSESASNLGVTKCVGKMTNPEMTKDVGKIINPEMTFSRNEPSTPDENQAKRSSGRKKYHPQIDNKENAPDEVAVENASSPYITVVKTEPAPKLAVSQSRSNIELTEDVGKITNPEMIVSRSEPSPTPDEKQVKTSSGRKKYRPRIYNKENAQDEVAEENASSPNITVVKTESAPKLAVSQSRRNLELTEDVGKIINPEMTFSRSEPSTPDEKQAKSPGRKRYRPRIENKENAPDEIAVENALSPNITVVKSEPAPKLALRQSRRNLELTEDVGENTNQEIHFSSNDPSSKSDAKQAKKRSKRKKYRRRNSLKLAEENKENIKKEVTCKETVEIVCTTPNSSTEPKEKNAKNQGARPKLQSVMKNDSRQNIEPVTSIQSILTPNQEKRQGIKRKMEE